MAIKFQYNKTSLGELGKQLKMRQTALPTIKSKESALRSEVKKARDTARDFRRRLDALTAEYDYMAALWGEFDCSLLRVADVELATQKIAGVRTPVLEDVVFEEKAYDLFSSPVWYADGIDLLAKVGGFEIGGIAGVVLGAARMRKPVVIDGFISSAGALVAAVLAPASRDYMILGHGSAEPGHVAMARLLGKQPLLDLGMRLGEGTGAALALQLLDAARAIMTEMATFESANVTEEGLK